jgi:hypothetical protein
MFYYCWWHKFFIKLLIALNILYCWHWHVAQQYRTIVQFLLKLVMQTCHIGMLYVHCPCCVSYALNYGHLTILICPPEASLQIYRACICVWNPHFQQFYYSISPSAVLSECLFTLISKTFRRVQFQCNVTRGFCGNLHKEEIV